MAITGWQWHLPWLHSPHIPRRRSSAPTRWRFRIHRFSRRSIASSPACLPMAVGRSPPTGSSSSGSITPGAMPISTRTCGSMPDAPGSSRSSSSWSSGSNRRTIGHRAGMRYLVLTDIHANLEALDACLADARARGYDQALVLGDLVGYGADPNAVIERVQALQPLAIVRGNHDKVACGLEQAEGFNSVAKSAAHWTFDLLTPEHRTWLASLPAGPHTVCDLVQICHGSPFDEDAYIFDELDALRALKVSERPLCLFGHTHYPASFELSADAFDSIGPWTAAESRLALQEGSKY